MGLQLFFKILLFFSYTLFNKAEKHLNNMFTCKLQKKNQKKMLYFPTTFLVTLTTSYNYKLLLCKTYHVLI